MHWNCICVYLDRQYDARIIVYAVIKKRSPKAICFQESIKTLLYTNAKYIFLNILYLLYILNL